MNKNVLKVTKIKNIIKLTQKSQNTYKSNKKVSGLRKTNKTWISIEKMSYIKNKKKTKRKENMKHNKET